MGIKNWWRNKKELRELENQREKIENDIRKIEEKRIDKFEKEVEKKLGKIVKKTTGCRFCGNPNCLCMEVSYASLFYETRWEVVNGIIPLCEKCRDFGDYPEKSEIKEIPDIMKALKNKNITPKEFIIIRDKFFENQEIKEKKQSEQDIKNEKIRFKKSLMEIKNKYGI